MVKIFLHIGRISGIGDHPDRFAEGVEEPMSHNPNIQRILGESKIPSEHQRPSKQALSR